MSIKNNLYLFALTFVIAFWGFITPMFEFPDEQVHLESVDYVTRYGHIPSKLSLDVTLEMYKTQELLGTLRSDSGQNKYTYHPDYRIQYTDSIIGKYEKDIKEFNTRENRTIKVKQEAARYPIAYYLYSSFWQKLVNNSDLITRVFAVRLGSLPLAFLMVYFAYQIGLLVFGTGRLALTLALLTFFQPMFSFMTAGINSDNLHNLLFCALFYYSLLLIKTGLSWKSGLSLFAITFLDIFTKPQGYIAIPLIVVALTVSAIKRRQWRGILVFAAISLLLLHTTSDIWLDYFTAPNSRGVDLSSFLDFSFNKLVTQNIVWYWGVFKWLGVVLPPIYWQIANRVVLLSVIGLVAYVWKAASGYTQTGPERSRRIIADPYAISFLLLAILTYSLAIYWADWQHHKSLGYSLGIQARYFFPTIAAQFTLLMTGILSFGWSDKSRRWLQSALVLIFLWLQIGGIWRLTTSYYSVASIPDFVVQVSQYKPWYLKGGWWYVWGSLYFSSLLFLVKNALIPRNPPVAQPRHKK